MVPKNLIDEKEYWYYDTFEHGDVTESDKIKEALEKYFEEYSRQ